MDMTNMYWEVYADQDGDDFEYVGYTDALGNKIVAEITGDLDAMVEEIKRQNGFATEVRIYRREFN